MNIKMQQGSPEELETVFKIAKAKSSEDKKYTPIILELKDKSKKKWVMAGVDTFRYVNTENANTGRTDRDVLIEQRFVDFVMHLDYRGIICVIPATDLNLNVLATHVDDDIWVMHTEDWVKTEVEKRYADVKPVRNAKLEHTPPALQDTQMSEEARLKQQVIELQKALDESKKKLVQEHGDTKYDPESLRMEDEELSNQAQEAKKRVYENHADEIAEMKARGVKRPDLTVEFKKWFKEERECIPQAK